MDHILHIHVTKRHICIVLHLLNKSAFIILLETTDSLRLFCVLFIYISVQVYRQRLSSSGLKAKDT
jgi:hypothetical protein